MWPFQIEIENTSKSISTEIIILFQLLVCLLAQCSSDKYVCLVFTVTDCALKLKQTTVDELFKKAARI